LLLGFHGSLLLGACPAGWLFLLYGMLVLRTIGVQSLVADQFPAPTGFATIRLLLARTLSACAFDFSIC
jgi:hypothetical protein